MSLTRQIVQKMHSIGYKISARGYKHSQEWSSHRHNRGVPPTDWHAVQDGVAKVCTESNVILSDIEINPARYSAFKREFKLPPLSLYAMHCRDKKFVEHYIAFDLLGLKQGARYIDIASESSPFPDFARERLGLEAYSQDLTYPAGLHGHRIGSSADTLPVPDNWVDGASLQCAFEHFQGDIDSNFIRELARVLKPGGRCVIVPLYLHHDPLNIYDPILYSDWDDSTADPGATIVAEVALGGHFERVYSHATLQRILIDGIGLKYKILRVTGLNELSVAEQLSQREHSVLMRVRYTLLVEKTGTTPIDHSPEN